MDVAVVDIETFWTQLYSLSKISFIEYCRSPEFEVISCSVSINGEPADCVFGHDEVGQRLRQIDWTKTVMVAHNGNEFDFPAIFWAYGIKAALYVDTLCMARPIHQSQAGGSLAKLCKHYGLDEKDSSILVKTQGKRLADFTPGELAEMAVYNPGDTNKTWQIYQILLPHTPPVELLAMDMTARMILEPKFQVDVELLEETLAKVKKKKAETLTKLVWLLGCKDLDEVEALLQSSAKFADVLRTFGVEPPTKLSKKAKDADGKPKVTYALAKTDQAFLDLLEHEDENVQAICAARLGVKSTLLETRIEKMLLVNSLCPEGLPIPLAYASATTGRWGGRIFNAQNFPRIYRKKPQLSDALRMSLAAPPGHKVVVSDLSGIELRVNHYLWQVKSSMAAFAADPQADLYIDFASEHLYKRQLTANDKLERQLGKVAQLGLGFGSGSQTFKGVAKNLSGGEIVLSDEESERVKNVWRAAYREIVQGWRSCQVAISAMMEGTKYTIDPLGLCEASEGKVRLPSGRYLYYPALREEWNEEDEKLDTWYGIGRNKSRIYGPLFDENIVQAIARDVILFHALKLKQLTGKLPSLMVHDELVYVVPDSLAESHLQTVLEVMRKPPKWLPGIVLWSEGDIADCYGSAK